MPDFTQHPKAATTISSSQVAEHFKKISAWLDRVHEGYDLVYSAVSLNVTIEKGRAYISGYEVGEPATDSDVPKTLTASQTNHIYLDKTGTLIINTTGVDPADSIKLWVAVTDGSGVTGTPTDARFFGVDVDTDLFADTIESRGSVAGEYLDLVKLQPYVRFEDLTGGGVIRRLWNRNGKLQVTDDAGTILIDDVAALSVVGLKDPVRAATTANITLSGAQTIDGVSIIAGDRVLVKNQSTGAQNGVYVAAAGAWARASDADTSAKVKSGMLVAVNEGTTQGDSIWIITSNDPIVLGTDSLTFTQADAIGATSAATALKIIKRDSAGRAKVADPSAVDDIDTKGARDTADTAHVAAGDPHTQYTLDTDFTTHTGTTSAPIHGSTVAPTASRIIHRDAAGRAQVEAPSADKDIANKIYVDNFVQGADWKASVRVATTAAGTIASDFENGDTVDGVVLATGDRILIKNQAAGAENGIYTVNASGAPTRATDADSSADVTGGMSVWVNEGTTNADTGWTLTTNDPITLGTTALVFTQFSGLGQVVAGSGLSKTGSQLDVNVDDSTIEISADALRQKDDGTTNAKLANMATDTIKGRTTAGTGDPEDLSPTDAVGVLNVGGVFDTQVRTSRLDQMAAPTAPVSLNSQKITNLATPTASTDSANKAYADTKAAAYAGYDHTVAAATGDLLAEGPMDLVPLSSDVDRHAVFPGYLSARAITDRELYVASTSVGQTSGAPDSRVLAGAYGIKVSIKGRWKALSGTLLNANYERFAIGLGIRDLSTGVSGDDFDEAFAHITETERDNKDAIAGIINSTNDVKRYNVAVAGDASYSNPSSGAGTADPANEIGFEMSYELPSSYVNPSSAKVTIKIIKSDGTVHTVYNEVAPVTTDTSQDTWIPTIAVNTIGVFSKLRYEVRKAA